jgi:hypothetical protein
MPFPLAKLLQPKVAKTTDELLAQMKATPEESELVKAVDDGPYTEWVLKAMRKKLIRLPEDTKKLVDALALFTKLKRSPEFKNTHSPDINTYKPADLYALDSKSDLTSGKEKIRDLIQKGGPGARLIASEGGIKVFYVTEPEPLTILSSNTKWCVANKDTAETYMHDGPAFMFYKGDKPFALLHPKSKQFMDPRDDEIWHGLDYSHYDDLPNIFFIDSRTPYYSALMTAWQTPQMEKLVENGDFPEMVTEDDRDDTVYRMFENKDIEVVLKYYASREAAGIDADADDLKDIAALVTDKPNENLQTLLWNIGVHEGPNELATKVARTHPHEIVEAFRSLGGDKDAVSALGVFIDNSQMLMGDTNWDEDNVRAIGASFTGKQILSHLYRSGLDLTYLGDVDVLLLQGAAESNPEQVAKDIFGKFQHSTAAQWSKWLNAEFIASDAKIPKAFYDTFRELIKTSPAKKSSAKDYVSTTAALVPKQAEDFADPEQKIPSHGTSLAQVPALHKKVKLTPGTRNLDYGGGRYDHATDFLKESRSKKALTAADIVRIRR